MNENKINNSLIKQRKVKGGWSKVGMGEIMGIKAKGRQILKCHDKELGTISWATESQQQILSSGVFLVLPPPSGEPVYLLRFWGKNQIL